MPNRRRAPAAASSFVAQPPSAAILESGITTFMGLEFCRSCSSPAYIIGKSPATGPAYLALPTSLLKACPKSNDSSCFFQTAASSLCCYSFLLSASISIAPRPPLLREPRLGIQTPASSIRKAPTQARLAVFSQAVDESLHRPTLAYQRKQPLIARIPPISLFSATPPLRNKQSTDIQ
ncbi:hypothetical protein TRIATDRAFT_311056 [Trichoderma atroviride IMI 206040]|uniref:Uncharacterized protein n=1 Tax=Hypocrea atroviridis (strain ATCC 20476 / IMI 206040) TaxID=452589 RepID=G9P2K6_HYPAI|nr:uncharacterized protein TRIATDRAFT_311056 [Trichoderma atroviride IMI 206040]EHK43524.1 hypothetical protein TRIATDRAFT_311056 [Trichoderma atroviride IMI 206040]